MTTQTAPPYNLISGTLLFISLIYADLANNQTRMQHNEKINIIIQTTYTTTQYTLNKNDKLLKLKQEIEQLQKIPLNNQKLFHNRTFIGFVLDRAELLDNDKSLIDYKIKNNTTLHLIVE